MWRRVWRVPGVEAYARVTSSNDVASLRAQEGAEPYTVILAEEQLEGRGREGRAWHSPPDTGIWMSVLLPSSSPPPLHLPLLVGVGVARALEDAVPGLVTRVEWPNDLTLGGRKVAGILCEAGHGAVIAGVGINVRRLPHGIAGAVAREATSLEEESGGAVSRPAVVGAVLRELKSLVGSGPGRELAPGIWEELKERDALFGRGVVSSRHGKGTARGIAPDGALLLETAPGHVERVIAGSVRPL